ncbi:MAG: aminotransferase class I/II-fold pyridoxal phosphate-dependent enzyme [Bacteroidota bacterium]|nr:O-acetylhomoserine sulfhydrylase [Odoribacter sp.]MDP3643994.1 aminotransferase class I/II-fold pyridoxal phosphate-dependent enzyme [Bacteroidota bacterium]
MERQGFSTRVIHTEYAKKDAHNALQMPIYSNAAFEFDTAEQMENAFLGRSPDHAYSRISNPTVENFEQRIRSITGAMGVTALSSGMAAISNVFFTIAKSGDNIITSRHLFGNTYSFLTSTLNAFGVETRFCDLTNVEEVANAINKKTIAVFLETITNPQLEIADIASLSKISREHGVLLIVDSTLTPPNIFAALEFGVDIEIISSTKMITGGATSMGGLVLDYGKFDWSKFAKLSDLAQRFGPFAFNAKLRREIFRNLGACLSPYHAYLQSLGLETLSLRFDKAASNCLLLAEYLQTEGKITDVNYPGLKTSAFYEVGKKQFGSYPGAMLTFNFSRREECFVFLNKLKIISRASNIYDNRSLIIHPASTIFCDYTPEKRAELGVSDTLIRLSVGIEEVEDLKNELHTALI